MDGAQRERGKMDRALQAFLQGRTPLTEERVVWSGGGRELVQTRGAYALEAETALPLGLVTSVRAVLTRGRDIMVVRDPGGEHIVPGGRIDDGEELLEALKRELMEETGWSVRGTPTRLGLFHYHIHSPKPERYPYPYPDFLQILYRAKADSHIPEAMEADGYELGAAFRPRAVVQRLPLSPGEIALLQILYD